MTPGIPNDPTDEFLFRYVAGLCTAPERVEVEVWAAREARNAARIERVRRIWRASRATPAPDVDRLWTQLRAATHERIAAAPRSVPSSEMYPRRRGVAGLLRRHPRASRVGGVAAAIVALVGGALLYSPRLHRAASTSTAAAPQIYATGPAQTTHIRLRDGSGVILAPMSRLRVPDDFGRRERTVTLDGQGFFDVRHDTALPFRVRTRGVIAEDIGTRFDLRAYPEDTVVVVIVAEGAVAVGRAHGDTTMPGAEGVVVRSGERARFGDSDSVTTIDMVSLRLLGWTEGRLSFVHAPLAEVARTIGRWYDLDVRVSDPTLARRLITADFDTQSAAEMIETLATAVGGVVTRDGRVLTIRAKP